MSFNAENDDIPNDLLERAEMLQEMMLSFVEYGGFDEKKYQKIRRSFITSNYKDNLPWFIIKCRDIEHLESSIRSIPSYDCGDIYNYFNPLILQIEEENLELSKEETSVPSDGIITETLSSFDPDGVGKAWESALNRRGKDPAGAITAARTLLEDVCKRILDDADQKYGNDDLPKLYKKTAETLNLSPTQHDEKIFKTILGGCQTVVENLGTLRNRLGDAHGQGRKRSRPLPRHAELAVNLAGSMATFLVKTWRVKSKDS